MVKAGRKIGPWQCLKWVLLVCCFTSIWQVVQLQTGTGTFLLGNQALLPSDPRAFAFSNTADKLKHLAKALSISVPAESPLTGHASKANTPAALPNDVSGAALLAEKLSFWASGPLEALAPREAAETEDADDPNALAAGKEGSEDSDGNTKRGECNDVHPNADSPDMLHVMFACDLAQIEGVQASVASVVANAAAPDDLTVHVMVQKKWIREFKASFGLEEKCWGTVTVTGVLIRVHSVDGTLIEKSVAKVASSIRKERGAINTIENFARFYMHLILPKAIVVYLDADTIVQADLGQLRKQLLESGRTVGFVKRETTVLMNKFLNQPKNCKNKYERWKDLMKMPAYNVGVFAVNLERWSRLRIWERVEDLVSSHNQCDGKLWIGGSQPPLLLAFLNHPKDEQDDFIVFQSGWNSGDLGWRKGIPTDKLKKKYVLHWNGNQKPWFPNGLYRNLWMPYRERFDALLRPYGDPDQKVQVQWYVNTDCDPDMKERAQSCEQTCAGQGRACDLPKLQGISSQDAVSTAAQAAGHTCMSYVTVTIAGVWDGPWVQGEGVCSYHQSGDWQGSCSAQPVCGYSRLCACKSSPKGAKKPKAVKAEKPKDGKGRRRATTPAPTAEQVAAFKKCPHVQLLDSWSDIADTCVLGKTFGCASDPRSMWTQELCAGMFSVQGVPTRCGALAAGGAANKGNKQTCAAGRMQKPSGACDLMLVSSFFTTRKDWQRDKFTKPSFSKFQKLYRTVFDLGLNMTIIYDELPEDLLKRYGCDRWKWEKVSLSDHDEKYGVNDVRYFFFEQLLVQHIEWKYVFVIDTFDVLVKMSPCPSLQPGKLYVGSEREKLKGHPWMKARYLKLGGKYNDWYKQKVAASMNIMNCGITGGHRDTMLLLFRKMIGVMSDPNLACRKANQDINVNMAALNYIVYNSFQTKFVTGSPVHSLYKRFEANRKDVWFVHK